MNTSPSPRPAGPPPLLVAALITVALMGGWVILWALGLFESLGVTFTALILGADLLAIGIIWWIFLRRDLSRRR